MMGCLSRLLVSSRCLKERIRGHEGSSRKFPVLTIEQGELWLTLGSSAQQPWVNRENAHCPSICASGPTPTPPHSGNLYLCKLRGWAVLLRLPAWAAHWSSRAAPASVQSADTGPSTDATEVRLPIGLVTWKSPQWHHCVLAGGRQEGTPRKTQICCMFWKNRRQRST